MAVGSALGLQAGTGGTLSTSGPPGSFTAYIQVPVTNKAGGRVVVAGPDRSGLRCGDCQHGQPLCRLRRPRPSWRQEHTDQQLQGHAWGHGERQGKNRVRDLRGGSDPGRHPHCHDAGLAIPWVLLRTSSFAVPATAIGLVAEVPVGLVVTLVLGDLFGRIGA